MESELVLYRMSSPVGVDGVDGGESGDGDDDGEGDDGSGDGGVRWWCMMAVIAVMMLWTWTWVSRGLVMDALSGNMRVVVAGIVVA
jgi:hypothetical protein